jgi:hypothetical protein
VIFAPRSGDVAGGPYDDKKKQHCLSRSVCKGWCNKQWHRRQMALFEVLAGERMRRFPEFKGRDLNSHSSSLEGYRRMYALFEPTRAGLASGFLQASQIIRLQQAHTSYPPKVGEAGAFCRR